MQPHSMCAVAIAGYIWNSHKKQKVLKCVMSVEYRDRYRKLKVNIYDLTDIEEGDKGRELKFRIMRSGGGLACKVLARRISHSEGTKVVMTHETIHIAGLREEYKLYTMEVREGRHYNSIRYGEFSGFFGAGRESLSLKCDIKNDEGYFVTTDYKLKMTQLVTKEPDEDDKKTDS